MGWRFVYYTAVVLGVASLASYLVHGADEEGVRHLLRFTARTSLGFFSLAFAARALQQLFGLTWFLANRRYLGVSFGVSHGYHLMAILALAKLQGASRFVAEQGLGLWLGAFGYLVIAALVATSFDASAAWLGPRRWKILHTTGMWGLGAFFALTYVKAALELGGVYVLFAATALAAPILRGVAWVQSRRAI